MQLGTRSIYSNWAKYNNNMEEAKLDKTLTSESVKLKITGHLPMAMRISVLQVNGFVTLSLQ